VSAEWHDFPADAEVEAGFAEALREAPPGSAPAPATLRVNDFLKGLGFAALAILALHLLLGLVRFGGPPRYAVEAAAMVVVGWVLSRWLKRLSQEGRAVDAKGNVLGGDAVLAAYRAFVLGEGFRAFGEASGVEGDLPEGLAVRPAESDPDPDRLEGDTVRAVAGAAAGAGRGGVVVPDRAGATDARVLVGRTADRLVLVRWDAGALRLCRAGVALTSVRAVRPAQHGGEVELALEGARDGVRATILLRGVDAATLEPFLRGNPDPAPDPAPATTATPGARAPSADPA
jgi:hypothetical protein